ncbi:MAG: ribosome maturation factor RimM [Firmicutes bacterium]|nr:ribosome maturation factor RimM [Bacillota bacterium]
MDKILIATISRPQGIKGEIKINPITDDVNRFKKLKEVYIDGISRKILGVRINGAEVYIYLNNVIDRNGAELLRGKEIFIDKKDADIREGRYLISDVIGCEIVSDGKVLGVLSEVLQYSPVDTYLAKNLQNKIFMFPALDDVILEIDVINKKITLNQKRFLEVVSYED